MTRARDIREKATELAERVASREGCELVHCEYRREGSDWVLRVFIDKEGGVGLEDCSSVSRELSTHLDVEDLVPHAYKLEVSSPGLDRPLRDDSDYRRFTGETVRINTYQSVRGRSAIVGTLKGLADDTVVVEEDGGQIFEIPLERVAKARLEPDL